MNHLEFVKEILSELDLTKSSQFLLPGDCNLTTVNLSSRGATASWVIAIKLKYADSCFNCGVSPTISHHILPADLFPELITDLDNGVALCRRCHGVLHNQLAKRGFVTRLDFEQTLGLRTQTMPDTFYTVEQLSEQTGFSPKTIYNLTSYGAIRPPIRNKDKSLYKSKGVYHADTLARLKRFQELRATGRHPKDRILLILRNELMEDIRNECLN